MKIVFWGNGNRGIACFNALHKRGFNIEMVVAHPGGMKQWYGSLAEVATNCGVPVMQPENPNHRDFIRSLETTEADIFILAGYGKILHSETFNIPRIMTINLHAGRLPQYRGSSPLNWALINGEDSFGLSIIKVDDGIDSGPLLAERIYPIGVADTITELHEIANAMFPELLLEVLDKIDSGNIVMKEQDASKAGYYPLRFPDDGMVLWDQLTAEQVHNKIRALTEPYPCAFTFYNKRKINLISSEIHERFYAGEPGRIYQISSRGILVCALDRCLWIASAYDADSGEPFASLVKRYDKLATVRDIIAEWATKEL